MSDFIPVPDEVITTLFEQYYDARQRNYIDEENRLDDLLTQIYQNAYASSNNKALFKIELIGYKRGFSWVPDNSAMYGGTWAEVVANITIPVALFHKWFALYREGMDTPTSYHTKWDSFILALFDHASPFERDEINLIASCYNLRVDMEDKAIHAL